MNASQDPSKDAPADKPLTIEEKLNAPKKVSQFEKQRQQAEEKRRREAEENAAFLREFQEEFANEESDDERDQFQSHQYDREDSREWRRSPPYSSESRRASSCN